MTLPPEAISDIGASDLTGSYGSLWMAGFIV
jgi:hypothetical protein